MQGEKIYFYYFLFMFVACALLYWLKGDTSANFSLRQVVKLCTTIVLSLLKLASASTYNLNAQNQAGREIIRRENKILYGNKDRN